MLENRTYIGEVPWKGFPGRHEPLVDRDMFDQVQEVMELRGGGDGTRPRTNFHYLKGDVWCPRCDRRYYYIPGTSHTGDAHFYWVCSGRWTGNGCKMPYFRTADVERAVEDTYATVALPSGNSTGSSGSLTGCSGSSVIRSGRKPISESVSTKRGASRIVSGPRWASSNGRTLTTVSGSCPRS